jgi:hypothetical protein
VSHEFHFCSLTFFRLPLSKIDWWCSLNSPTAHYPVVQVFVFNLREGIPSLWLKYLRHWCTYDEEMIITAIYTKFGTRFSRYETSCDLQYPDMWRFWYENSMCPKTYNSFWLFTYRANDYSFCFWATQFHVPCRNLRRAILVQSTIQCLQQRHQEQASTRLVKLIDIKGRGSGVYWTSAAQNEDRKLQGQRSYDPLRRGAYFTFCLQNLYLRARLALVVMCPFYKLR